MSLPVAWITGAGGLIGSHLLRAAAAVAPGWDVRGLTRAELDLNDGQAVRRRWQAERPGLVIHAAAISATDACQHDPALARKTNVEATARLAELAAGVPLIFFSTDLVFDGRRGNYRETDPVNPLSVYGETKVAAEQVVLANPRHTVVRASLTFGFSPTENRSFVEGMLRAARAGRKVRLFTDEYRSLLAAAVTARAVWALAARAQPGLFHLGGAERLSRWAIGQLLAERWPELRPHLEPGSLRDYEGPPRPPDVSLDCARLQALLPFPLPRFSEWLRAQPPTAF